MPEGWTEISAEWAEQQAFIARNAAGLAIQMGNLDSRPGNSPMQMLLEALAGCTGMDIASILQKKRLAVTGLQVKVRGKRADDYPMVWTDIHITYLVWGENIPARDVEQAIQLSEEKYCSVGIMLGKAARITSEYHIFKPSENA
jgi:putative redox protein